MRRVNSHRNGLLARRGGPAASHFGGLRIDFDYLVCIGEISVNFAISGGGAVFRLATQLDIRN